MTGLLARLCFDSGPWGVCHLHPGINAYFIHIVSWSAIGDAVTAPLKTARTLEYVPWSLAMTCPILTLACAVNSVCSIYSNPGVHTVDGWMNEVEIKTLIHRIIHRITKKKSNKCCRVVFVEENNPTKLVSRLKRRHNFQYKECMKAKIKQCSGC